MSNALASAKQPLATYVGMQRLVEETIGVKLFTLMEIDRERNVARRSYTNSPDAYPVSGEKPLEHNRWTEHVEVGQNLFVANSISEIADVFPDYELIQSLGCESCLNIPIVIGGQVEGTLNCLHVAGHYTHEKVVAAESLKLAGALTFLMARRYKRVG
ncbi:MAG: GAF domain-containing protein [Granulosicoccus sp.]